MSGTLTIGNKEIFSHSDATDKVSYGSGIPAGSVIQCQQSVKTDTDSTRSSIIVNGLVDISGTDQNGSGSVFCVKITPKFSTSKILVSACINVGGDNASYTYLTLFRDSSSVFVGAANSNQPRITAMTFSYETNEGIIDMIPIQFLDAPTIPATPIEIVYKVKFACATTDDDTSTSTINKGFRDIAYSAGAYDPRSASSITVMEVTQ